MKQVAYLLEPPRFDVSGLYDKYDVRMVFEDSASVRTYLSRPEELYRQIKMWASGYFKPEKDLFVLTGNQTMIVVCAMALQSTHPEQQIRFLRFDSRYQKYMELVIDERCTPAGTGQLPIDQTDPSRDLLAADSTQGCGR